MFTSVVFYINIEVYSKNFIIFKSNEIFFDQILYTKLQI